MAKKEKGRATIRIAAVLFLASAVFEILNFNSAVALFGAVRFGAAALLYHFVFAALYAMTGIGMWTAKKWGYWAVMATTAIYTIDKIQLMLSPQAFYDYMKYSGKEGSANKFPRVLKNSRITDWEEYLKSQNYI